MVQSNRNYILQSNISKNIVLLLYQTTSTKWNQMGMGQKCL